MSDAGGQSRTPTGPELLRAAIQYHLDDLYTMLPGRVEEYNEVDQRADIKPLIQRRLIAEDGSELLEELPIITDVAIIFPRTSQYFLTFPIVKGDLVMLVFCMKSLDKYMASAGDQDIDPDDFKTHDISDAVAYPGMYPFGAAIKDINNFNLVIGKDNGGLQLHITPDGTMEIQVDGDSDEVVALGNALKTFWDTTYKTWQTTHTHPTGVGPSGPPTQAGAFPPFASNILSTILKVKSG